jgi:predicted nucleic-acid-binding Zn-ribbon protein
MSEPKKCICPKCGDEMAMILSIVGTPTLNENTVTVLIPTNMYYIKRCACGYEVKMAPHDGLIDCSEYPKTEVTKMVKHYKEVKQ